MVPHPEALQALQAGDAGLALDLLEGCGRRDAEWHAIRGMAMLAREAWAEARSDLMAAMSAGDTRPGTALNLALARARLGEHTAALAAIDLLGARHPDWSEPPFRMAELLRDAGDPDGAMAQYERALECQPRRVEALLRLATLRLQHGEAREAERLLIRCCGVDPQNWQAWDALGLAAVALGDPVAAEAAFSRAQRLNPGSLPVALRFVEATIARDNAGGALLQFEAASAADPLDIVALVARARLLAHLGAEDDAHQLMVAAVAIAPEPAPIAILRAEMLLHGTRFADTEAALREAVALDPDNVGLRHNLAVALTRTHRYAEALEILDSVEAEAGEAAGSLCNRSLALVCLGRQDEGVAAARRATELAPDMHLAWRGLASAMTYADGVGGNALTPVFAEVARTAPGAGLPAFATSRPGPAVDPDRRLRVGLLSATLRTHPVGWLTLAGWENLDPEAFELVCIGQPPETDMMHRRFRAIAAEWHPLAGRVPPDLGARVRALDLDVLVELGGYGEKGLLGHCAARLAPVQVKWVGMQNHTTGMAAMDWMLTDRWETPPDLARFYTERLLEMPDGYVCYSPPVHAPEVAALPALARGAVTFGCFNNLAKVTPRVVATWSAILRALPGARIVIKTHQLGDMSTASSVRARFAAHGVGAAQVELRGGSGHRALLGEYGEIDIVLDPFPYSGGLTTCEALWMGVPALTCPGETFASRHSASHMSNIGLSDWVVPDLDAYVAEAVRRAGDLDALAALRRGMRARLRSSPLCDGPRFGRNLGAALRRAWRETA